MAMFPANPTRLDPYKNFKFRIKWDGKYVAAVSKISTLQAHHRSDHASQRRRSLHAHMSPGQTRSTRHSPASAA